MENQTTEWKELWKDDHLKHICGFANSQGGVLEIGKNDAGKVVGVANIKKLLVELPNTIKNKLGIYPDVNQVQEGGKDIIQIVAGKSQRPISCNGKYYKRIGSTTQEISGTELTDFLLQGEERKWDARIEERVPLSSMNNDAVEHFRKEAIRHKRLSESEARTPSVELLERFYYVEDGQFTKAGAILFSIEPRRAATGAYVCIGKFPHPSELSHHEEVNAPAMLLPNKVIELLWFKYFKGLVSYEGQHKMNRAETYPVEREALREALMNAIVHKDYTTGDAIDIKIFTDHLIIYNCGKLPENWTIETLVSKHKSVKRNPSLAEAFYMAGHIERFGRGIEKMNKMCDEYGYPRPTFHPIGNTFAIMFEYSDKYKELEKKWGLASPIKNDGANDGANDGVKLSNVDKVVLIKISSDPHITASDLAANIGKSIPTIERSLKKLKANGLIKRVGSDKSGHWKVPQ